MHLRLGQARRYHAQDHRGLAAVARDFMLNLIGYNFVCLPKLLAT